jgi:hypothetical protein
MRPVIKKKRIDPRYFLNETIEEEIKLSVKQKAEMDKDDDGDIDAKDLAALRAKNKQEHDTATDDDDGDGVRNDDDGPGKTLLKSEKTLYEKIRSAIEEVFDEHLEENK